MSWQLHESGWADHSFLGYAWYNTTVNGHNFLEQGHFERDGDILKIKTEDESSKTCQRNDLNILVATYAKLAVRTRGTGNFTIEVYDDDSSSWKTIESGQAATSRFATDIYTLTGTVTTATKIKIGCSNHESDLIQ